MDLRFGYPLLSIPLIALLTFSGDARGPKEMTKEIHTICTAFIPDGKLEEKLADLAESERGFETNPAVLSRIFFQCRTQSQIIWALTKWTSEAAHNSAAHGMMKIRFDDRTAAAAFPEEPYFEGFFTEDESIKAGVHTAKIGYVIVGRGLIADGRMADFLAIRERRFREVKDRCPWMRVYSNIYNPSEFVFVLGFSSSESYEENRQVGNLFLEEYLFTGLEKPLGKTMLASYNQFACVPLDLGEAG
jgi:hypothetical protein